MSAAVGVERLFLNWAEPILPHAAEVLWERFGPGFAELRIAVPGRRAGRRLEELLLQRAVRENAQDWNPPQIQPVGEATDALVRPRHATAKSFAREVAWVEALRSVGPEQLRPLAPNLPSVDSPDQWLGMAEMVRNLHGEVLGGGRDFASLAASPALPAGSGEAARWQALALVQQRYRQILAKDRLEDPHLRRLDALAEARIQDAQTLVLIAIAELNPLQRALVELAAARGWKILALVAAPESEQDRFDALGCLQPEHWLDRPVGIAPECWSIVDRPEDQADEVVRALAELAEGRPVDDVAVCVATQEVHPSVRRKLAAQDLGLRDPVGPELSATGPWQFLEALASYTAATTPLALGALLRHADVEFAADAADVNVAAALKQLEDFRLRHLPTEVSGYWYQRPGDYKALAAGFEFIQSLQGESLRTDQPRTILELGEAIRDCLQAVYGKRSFDRSQAADRVCVSALEKLVQSLDELARLPEALAQTKLAPTALLRLLLRRTRAEAVTPAPAGERDLEALGWLDLPLDEAPFVVVAGVQQGVIPSTIHGDAFLPDSLRRALGMPDQDARTARDLYAARLLYESRRDSGGLRLIAGLQGPDGDPWMPSSLYFRCDPDQLAERTRIAFGEEHASTSAEDATATRLQYEAPVEGVWREPSAYSATALRQYLQSPYAFFLERVLRLRENREAGEELDPLHFGQLIHKVLEDFGGAADYRDCEDADAIADFLTNRLQEVAEQQFDRRRRAAVEMQIRHAAARLRTFAQHQAQSVAEGWRIEHAEWSPAGENEAVELQIEDVRFALRGTIDRVEKHASGAWRILDYKTGESPVGKSTVYATTAESWRDVQLPLYRHLFRSAKGDRGELQLGYFSLPKSPDRSGIWTGNKDGSPFDDETMARADAQIAEAIRGIRKAIAERDAEFFRQPGILREGSLVTVLAGGHYLTAAGEEADA